MIKPAGVKPRYRLDLALVALMASALTANCAPAQVRHTGQLDLRADCGATGDGKSDDSGALKTCITRLQSELNGGHPTVLRIPAGLYRITGANGTMPTIERRGGTIQGDGPHASYIILDPSYAGDLFSWSEAWTANNFGPPSYDPSKDMSGPTITGLQVTGSTDAKAQQNAFVFYDRDDHVLMRDIEVDYLNGQCLSIGRTLRMPQAYVRESAFYNLKCWNSGTRTNASVSISSTTTDRSDATNELDFFKLAIFDTPGDAIVVSNPNSTSATRRIRFFGLRVEHIEKDGIRLGNFDDIGQIADIDIYDLTAVNVKDTVLRIGPSSHAPPPYQISVIGGALGPGNHTAIDLEHGWYVDITLGRIDAPFKLSPLAGQYISVHGNGSESKWQYVGPRRPTLDVTAPTTPTQ